VRVVAVCIGISVLACKRDKVAPVAEAGIAEPSVTSEHPPTPRFLPTEPPLVFEESIPGDDPIHRATAGKCRPDPCRDVEVTLLVRVSASGSVESVTIEKGDANLGACLAKAARSARFPSGPGTFAVPFIYACDGGHSFDHGTKQKL
jgi:hypothetical protein